MLKSVPSLGLHYVFNMSAYAFCLMTAAHVVAPENVSGQHVQTLRRTSTGKSVFFSRASLLVYRPPVSRIGARTFLTHLDWFRAGVAIDCVPEFTVVKMT